ncbi:T-cell leukemia/lymphoma protein 1A [Dipodomys spectabilis]|uniref:T-cell leukemia/lymphoma protein 1A n=1 Tax=Dipodomys spectabilis TaxID=105255 RepID=UPI001C53AF3B|nr:T-cell leukemia/lymphoma protein 1A [Dipodomys spectabilis]
MHYAEVIEPPQRLWIWEKGVYKDENARIWLSIFTENENVSFVIMRQKDIPLGAPMSPNQLAPFPLPLMYQLYPENRYKSIDSRYWRIVYHIKFQGTEEMFLELLEDQR